MRGSSAGGARNARRSGLSGRTRAAGRRTSGPGCLLACLLLVACRGGMVTPGELERGEAGAAASPSGGGGTASVPNPSGGGAGSANTLTPTATDPNASPSSGAFDPNALLGPATLGPGTTSPLRALTAQIQAAAAASGVSANVLAAVIWAESRGDVNVAGGGLVQIGDNEFAAQKAAHPQQVQGTVKDAGANVMAGAYYLLQLRGVMQQKFNRSDLGITLRAYNSGEQGVDPNDLSALPAGTGAAEYVTNVTNYARIVATGAGSLPP